MYGFVVVIWRVALNPAKHTNATQTAASDMLDVRHYKQHKQKSL
jgi:hypothetical protein